MEYAERTTQGVHILRHCDQVVLHEKAAPYRQQKGKLHTERVDKQFKRKKVFIVLPGCVQ